MCSTSWARKQNSEVRVPNSESLKRLNTRPQIAAAWETLIRAQLTEEAHWLAVAEVSPDSANVGTTAARAALARAAEYLRLHPHTAAADWITEFLQGDD